MTTAPNPLLTEVPLSELSGELLRARVARAQVYLIAMAPVEGAAAVPAQLQREHIAYMRRLEAEGRLFGFGPVDVETGGPASDLAIVAAASRAEAATIAAAEPLHEAGLRRNTVRGHTMNEGVACYVARAMAKRAEALGDSFDANGATADGDTPPAGVQLYLVHLDPTDKPRPPEDQQTMNDHFVWLRDNEMSARLLTCGPAEAERPLAAGVWGGGLGIFATSREEAERIAALEPSGLAGYRKLSLQSWRLDYGLAAPIARSLTTLNRLPRA